MTGQAFIFATAPTIFTILTPIRKTPLFYAPYPIAPHYVENPGIESLDCFAQMIYDQGGNLYYYQEKLYYTILGGIQTDAVLAQANPTGTETKTLVKIQDTLTDTISAYQSSHSGAVVTGITPQILGAHNGKLYIKATVSYSISQNGTSSFQDQSVFLFYDCADGSTGQLENEEIQAQLDSGIPVYAVLSGNRMICLFTQKDQAAETLTATRENTYQLISVNLDSQKVEKTLDFDDVGIMELHLTQSGDFYLTEDVTDSENHTRTYYEYSAELEQKDEYTLDLNQFNSPWRLDNDLICTKMTPGVYALLGPNGAGKSTLMNIIVDNLRPNQGRVLFNGEDTLKLGKEFRRQLGYMPQQQGAYHDFTAKRFLWYMAALCGLKQKQAKERITDLLELVGLTDVQNQSIGSFSGGMKQRVFTGMSKLLTASFRGREETFRCKLGLSLSLTLAVYLVSYVPQMFLYVKAFGTPWSHAPLNSIMLLKDVSLGISVTGAILLNYGFKLLGLLLVSSITLWLSCHSYSILSVLVGASVIVLLPQLLSFMGLTPVDWISLNFLLYQSKFLCQVGTLPGIFQPVYYIIFALLFLLLMIWLTARIRKKWIQT